MSDTTQKQDNVARLRYWSGVIVKLSWILAVLLTCRFFVLAAEFELVEAESTESDSSRYDARSTSSEQQATDKAARDARGLAILMAMFMNFAYIIGVLCSAYFQNAVLSVFADILTELKAIREQQSRPAAQPPSSS